MVDFLLALGLTLLIVAGCGLIVYIVDKLVEFGIW